MTVLIHIPDLAGTGSSSHWRTVAKGRTNLFVYSELSPHIFPVRSHVVPYAHSNILQYSTLTFHGPHVYSVSRNIFEQIILFFP